MTLENVRNSAGVSLCALAAAVLGFLTQVVIAKLFGASAETDAYLTASALPFTLGGVVLAGVGYTLIPLLTTYREKQRLGQALGVCFLIVLALGLATGLAGTFLSARIVAWLAPQLRPEKLQLAAEIQTLFWWGVGCTLLSSFLASVHHFDRRFIVPAMATLLPSAGSIVFAVWLAAGIGIRGAAVGYLVGCFAQVATLWPGLRRRLQYGEPAIAALVWDFLSSSGPVMVSLLPFTLLPVIDAYWCSRLPDGSLSYLGYASRIVIALTSATTHGVAVVLFPQISENAAKGDLPTVRRRVIHALKFTWLLLVPLAVLLTVGREPLVAVLFERGQFNARATRGLAEVLPWYLAGMLAMAPMNVINRGFYALRHLRTPVLVGLACLVGYAAAGGWLSLWHGQVGIAVAYAAYWWGLFITSTILLGRAIGNLWDGATLAFSVRTLAVSGTTGLGLLAIARALPAAAGAAFRIASLSASAAVILPAAALLFFRTRELRKVILLRR